jgi:Flp pilus assembly protein TadG
VPAVFMHKLVRRAGRLCRDLPNCRFIRCNAGATAVEFVLIAAPFMALLIAIIQTLLVFFAGRVLDESTAQASRYILTGEAQQSDMTQAGFAKYLCENTSALFNCQNFMINVQNYSSFSSASTTAPTLTYNQQGQVNNNWNYSPGSANDIVVVQVMYEWPVMMGPLGFNLSNLPNGNRLLVSTAVFKNEPFGAGG